MRTIGVLWMICIRVRDCGKNADARPAFGTWSRLPILFVLVWCRHMREHDRLAVHTAKLTAERLGKGAHEEEFDLKNITGPSLRLQVHLLSNNKKEEQSTRKARL